MKIRLRQWLPILLGVPIAVTAAFGLSEPKTVQAAGSTSTQVAYVTDASAGGFVLWSDALGVAAPANGGPYSTASPASPLTVTIHNIDVSALDVPGNTALANIDTVVLYEACDVGAVPTAVKTLNSFLDGGGKLIILDGAQCVNGNGGDADYSVLERPFTNNYKLPVPNGPPFGTKPYTSVQSSTLTTGLPDCTPAPGCNEPGNAVADASVHSANSSGWCEAIGGTSGNGFAGPVEAYAHNKAGSGLIIHESEAFAYNSATAANQKHLRLVFDDALAQVWNPDGLQCAKSLKALSLTPASDSTFEGLNETLTATVTDGSGTPVSGTLVSFTVNTGPNVGTTGTGTTNGSGVATFTYTSSKAGTDTFTGSFNDGEDHVSNPANITWSKSPPPPVAETTFAIVVPLIGVLLLTGLVGGSLAWSRRRRETAG